jgi:hypothetical protein
MDNAEWKPNMHEGAYPKKKKSVAGQFAVKSRIGQKRIAGLKN